MNTQNTNVTAVVTKMIPQGEVLEVQEVKAKKRGGRKSLWETDYDAAVKRQWSRTMNELPRGVKRPLRKVPVKCEVVALFTADGEVVKMFAAKIGDAPRSPVKKIKVKEPQAPKKRGRKSLWETDPEAAATRELEKYQSNVLKESKQLKATKEKKVEQQAQANARELQKLKDSVFEKEKQLQMLKEMLDALMPKKHSV